MINYPVYLDNNATTQVDPLVLEAMLPYFTSHFGNAASKHAFGWVAEEAVRNARIQVANLINAQEQEIIFTSGATESNNLALKGIYEMYAEKGNHIITVKTEHKCVIDSAAHLERLGAKITFLSVDKDGLINLQELENAITDKTILISVMYANNEIGVIQPIREISAIAKKHGVLFHTDAAQAAGKIPVDVIADGIDLLSLSAHKMYGPKGVGALYVRRKNPRVKVLAQMDGGGHERGMRSGTLNVPGIVGLGKAAEIAKNTLAEEMIRISKLRDKLENALLQIEEVFVNGTRVHRLPNITNMSFKYVEGEGVMTAMKDISVSSGSACNSNSLEPSYVLKSLGLGKELDLAAALRFGLGRFTTEAEIDFAIQKITEAVNVRREQSPIWEMFKEGIDLDKVEWSHH